MTENCFKELVFIIFLALKHDLSSYTILKTGPLVRIFYLFGYYVLIENKHRSGLVKFKRFYKILNILKVDILLVLILVLSSALSVKQFILHYFLLYSD